MRSRRRSKDREHSITKSGRRIGPRCRAVPLRSAPDSSKHGQAEIVQTNNRNDGPMLATTAARPSAQFITPPAAYSYVLNVRRRAGLAHVRAPHHGDRQCDRGHLRSSTA